MILYFHILNANTSTGYLKNYFLSFMKDFQILCRPEMLEAEVKILEERQVRLRTSDLYHCLWVL